MNELLTKIDDHLTNSKEYLNNMSRTTKRTKAKTSVNKLQNAKNYTNHPIITLDKEGSQYSKKRMSYIRWHSKYYSWNTTRARNTKTWQKNFVRRTQESFVLKWRKKTYETFLTNRNDVQTMKKKTKRKDEIPFTCRKEKKLIRRRSIYEAWKEILLISKKIKITRKI